MSGYGYLAFVGTNSVRGSRGIYTLAVDGETFRPRIVSTHQVYNTGTLSMSRTRNLLYAGIEGMTFKGLADGGVIAYSFDGTGVLTEIGAARSHGQRTCTVAVDADTENLYGCNFYEGTFAMWSLDAAGAPLPARKVIAPPDIPGSFKALHCIAPIGKDYIGVISLCECALVIYAASDGRRITSFEFPGHPFCRYLETAGGCIYALMQDPGDIYVFRNCLDESGTIEHIQTICVQDEPLERYGTTVLRATPDGRLMISATRNNSTLTVFRILPDGRLERRNIVSLPGETPRDFAISRDGEIVCTCLQKSDAVCIHRIDYERETLLDTGHRISVPSPAAMAVTGRI